MYTFTRSKQLEDFAGFLGKLPSIDYLADSQILQYMPERLQGLDPANLATYSSFHPPRLIRACRNGALIPFFGAGLSLAAGIPSW